MLKFLVASSITLISILPSGYAQDSAIQSAFTASGAAISGSEKGPSLKVGFDVRSGSLFKIDGSVGRESANYRSVGHIDTILKREVPLADDKDIVLVLGYSPITVRSTSTLNVTEALFKANMGVALKDLRTRLLYSVSPLSSITDRSGQLGSHAALIHGFSVEQDIGNIAKISSQLKLSGADDVSYMSSQSKVEVPVSGKFILYGFYEVDRLQSNSPSISSIERSATKSNLTTVGAGIKIGLSSTSKQ